MDKLLYLCHRIPYPPNKGDKVRSFQILKELSRHYEVYLGAFVDEPDDWQHRGALEPYCAEVHLEPLSPRWATLRSAPGLIRGEPLTLPYYRRPAMARWVRGAVETHGIDRVLVFSSSMAQYVEALARPPKRVVVDFVDLDSAKWLSYGGRKQWPASVIYRREGTRLADYERRLARTADASLFVSPEEADLLLRLEPALRGRVLSVPNGVDADYFDPALDYPCPYPGDHPAVVFTGAMDYWPNVDAVTWFAKEVFPSLRTRFPGVSFAIVGARPVREVEALGGQSGIQVTGTVPDVRPYLRHADVAVAPLRVARGIQNKVLEALAMARPIIVTPEAAEGLAMGSLLRQWTARGVEEMAELLSSLLTDPDYAAAMGAEGRRMVLDHHCWAANLRSLRTLLDGAAHREAPDLPPRLAEPA